MRLALLSFLLILPRVVLAQDADPVAVEDLFDVSMDSSLVVSAPGLLDNDEIGEDSLQVLLVTEPENGSVTLNADGSFSYTPDPGFNGIDRFEYQIETVPLQRLTVDSLQSLLNFDMHVDVPVVGSDGAEGEGRIGGSAAMYVNDSTGHLYDLNIEVIDSLSLGFRFGGIVTIARLFVDADPRAFQLQLSQRTEPSEIIDGLFMQEGAKVQVAGIVNLEGNGLLNGQVPEEPQEFDTETEADIDIQLTYTDSTLTADVPVDLEEAFELSGVDVEMRVTGSLTATGPLLTAKTSNLAQVLITVDPISRTDIADELPGTFTLHQNYPNPFNPSTTIAYSIPRADHVMLKVYDTLGREVATLVDGVQPTGMHEVVFDAHQLPSGIYLYRLEAGSFSDSKTLLLVK